MRKGIRMAKRGKDTKTSSIIVNLIIVLWMAYCCFVMFTKGLDGNMSGSKFIGLRYFTIDSNILAAVSALVMLIARAVKGTPSSFAVVFKYVGTVAVTLTLITVLVFLGPSHGFAKMFAGNNLYMHLIGPVLCIISFCWLDKGPRIQKSHIGSSVIPVIIYGLVYFVMVVVAKSWPDFYGFNRGGKWYISMAVMFAGTLLISIVLKALHNDK